MTCRNPILVGPDGYKSMVRCGRCMPCRVRRKQAWVGRMILERADHVAARFITLTYAEREKQQAELEYEDFQKFLKRYRYYYGPMRFFAVGEYGERSGNAHWHLIVFGHGPDAQGFLHDFKPWPLGFSYDGTVTLQSIGYVAKYATKEMPRGRRNISEMSRDPGLGLGRIMKLGDAVAASLQGRRLDSWPGRLSILDKRYPLIEGGLKAFQTAFLNSGGLPPAVLTPDDRHTVSMEQFADLGTRIQSARAFNEDHWRSVGTIGLEVKDGEKV